ncbi:LIM domain only protein 7-like isoform X2 [Patiria miniata]|uniref:LIM and calponin homology domains-containing protein 1-like n=1 Tax=Patiria miniata TaxID=46514 RepID=A0A913ZV39_PATMI|nr:LIM domain only protein 7-like isoform X2 [Patiria miniata]
MMDVDSDSERSASLRHPDRGEQTSLEDALVEARRWIENVTGMKFRTDDFRKSMTDGILLCMLLQKIKPGLIKKINKSRSIYAGVDNLNVFLGACEDLGLKAAQLFHPGDLQDLSSRASLSVQERRKEEERRLKSVCITIFWLGRTANQLDTYTGPHLNLDAFAPLIHGSSSLVKGLSPDNASSGVSSWASGTSTNNNFRSSLGYNDDVFTSDGIDLTAIAPEKYTEPKWKRDLRRELDSSVPGLSDYTGNVNSKPVLRMDSSRRRPPPVAAKPLHTRTRSMPERSNLERQNSVEDEDSQSYRSGSSGEPMSPTTYDEFVKSKGMVQEDQEVWMSSLDSWKSRRRRATHSALERKASREEVEQNEQSRQRRRSKTYQEMMEEKEKREKILMKMATKNKSLDAEDIVHILTKPSLYEDEIQDVPERRPRSKSIPGNYKHGESSFPTFDTTNPSHDTTDAPSLSRQPPPDVSPKLKVRRSGVGSAFAPYQRTDSRGSSNGRKTMQSTQRVDDFTDLRPGHVEPLTFREKLLRDRDREIGLSVQQRDSKSSACLPQKKRLSMGIMGRVAAFNKGEGEDEHKAKPQPPKPAPKPSKEPEYTELTIKMKQRPRNEDGFGFTIFGGADSGRSIVVTSITPGSTAEKCELKVGDEIVAINGETTKMVTYDHALFCFSSSVLDGELTLKVHRYEDLGNRARSTTSTRSTERSPAKSDPSEFSKRRAMSQPTDPKNLSQAARARKILEQMREEEQRMEDMRREREEERMGVAVNGNQNWNHSDNKRDPLRAYYDEPEPEERHLGDAIPSGPAAPSVSKPKDSAPLGGPEQTSVVESEIKQEAVKPEEKLDLLLNLTRSSPNGEQYGKPSQVGVDVLGDEIPLKRDAISPDAGIVLDNDSKEDLDRKYPSENGSKPQVVDESIEPEDNLVIVGEQSVNLWKLLGHDALETPESDPLAKNGNVPEETGPDGGILDGSPDREIGRSKPHSHWINNLERLTMSMTMESDGEMFSSEDEERMEEEIMNRMQEEQRAEEEAEARHRRIQNDEKNKSPIEEDFITPQSKQAEEAPISFKSIPSEASAPAQMPWQQSENLPSSTSTTTVDSSKPPKYHPVKFTSGPKPFSNRRGPEPYKPPTFKPVSVKDNGPGVKQDMLKRRSDFFSKPPEMDQLPVFGYSDDERDMNNRSGQSSPVVGESVTAEVQQPIEAAIEQQVQEPVESSVRPQSKQPASLASRKAFNVEEEKKRLERWHAEQERIRQEQYEQEQRRLREQQEKDLERAESEERKRKMEEQQRLMEKQKILHEQAAEERKRLEEERKERVRKEQEYLERARLEREDAERERLKDEEEQQKMAAERKMREQEQLRREEEKRKRKEAERKAEEEAQRRRDEEELHRQELERQDREAEERRLEINRLREKEAEERARRKEEEERLAREQEEKEKERFARLRQEEIERIRAEEREKLQKEWEELQREKAKQKEREQVERERLEQLRAEQERLRQERIKLEKQQEEERRQLQREKERLLAQSTNSKPDADKIPYNKSDKNPDVIDKDNHYGEYGEPVKEREVIVSEEKKDVYSAPPQKNNDSYKVPGQAYMSQFKDGSMGTQHWMVEEAERRRLAEKTGTSHSHDPVEVHTRPIVRQDLDLEPVLEKKNYAPEHLAPVRHMDKRVSPEPMKIREQDVRQHPPPSQNPKSQAYREVAVDVPSDFQPVPRRLRAPEIEAEKKKKQNRQSMPDMGNRVPDVVRNDVYAPPVPPHSSDRNSARMPERIPQQPQLGPPGRTSAFQQPSKKPAPGRSVSGKVVCSNCSKTLGKGSAMIVESLGLHFHIQCFRCCVCNVQLANGTKGTDVRIRASKLHCQNCYSNDAGFEFTEV